MLDRIQSTGMAAVGSTRMGAVGSTGTGRLVLTPAGVTPAASAGTGGGGGGGAHPGDDAGAMTRGVGSPAARAADGPHSVARPGSGSRSPLGGQLAVGPRCPGGSPEPAAAVGRPGPWRGWAPAQGPGATRPSRRRVELFGGRRLPPRWHRRRPRPTQPSSTTYRQRWRRRRSAGPRPGRSGGSRAR